jgi:hypothetical protein
VRKTYPPILKEGKVKEVGKCQYISKEKEITRETKSCPPILEDKKVGKINIHPYFGHKLA